MLSGNGVKTVRCSYDPLCDPLRLKMLSGNGAQANTVSMRAFANMDCELDASMDSSAEVGTYWMIREDNGCH